jgi:hypothetical protein
MFGEFATSKILKSGLVLSLSLILCACGGGGGGGGSPATVASTSSSAAPKLTANAGADFSVNTFAQVELDPKVSVAKNLMTSLNSTGLVVTGDSTKPSDIVELSWKQTEGPAVNFFINGLHDAVLRFKVPSIGSANSVKIVFILTIKNAAGETATDSITITVNRVNQPPVADAGTPQDVQAKTVVSLNASASKDPDGTIQKFSWSQTSGPSVALSATTIASPSFTAPEVNILTTLEFEVSTEDNDGAKSTAKVQIKVAPFGSPEALIYFPPAVGIYEKPTISAVGSAKTYDATLTSVTVDIGAGPVVATVKEDGTWRLDNLNVPNGVSSFSVSVEVTDSLGRKGTSVSTLQTSKNSSVGTGAAWDNIVAINVDSTNDKLFMLSSDRTESNTRLLSVDLKTGNRSADISSFNNPTQGIKGVGLGSMAYDSTNKLAYVTAAPADSNLTNQIISIHTETGQRTLVSDNTRGTGPELKLPYGIVAANPTTLYVADNLSSTIISVDKQSGNRTEIANSSTLLYGIDAPAVLAQDPLDPKGQVFVMPNAQLNYVLGINVNTNPAISFLVFDSSLSNSGTAISGLPKGVAVDTLLNRFFVLDIWGDIVSIDMATEKSTKLTAVGVSGDRLGYDSNKHLLYIVEDFPTRLWAVEPITGQAVMISSY